MARDFMQDFELRMHTCSCDKYDPQSYRTKLKVDDLRITAITASAIPVIMELTIAIRVHILSI